MARICYRTIFPVEGSKCLEDGEYFCSALDTGVVLLFLRFGADPNTPSCKNTRTDFELPAWLRFFFVPFRIRVLLKFHDRYLGTLRKLLIGADFKAVKSIS